MLRAAGYMRLRAAGWELLATWGLSLAGFLLLCQGSKWLNGKSVWLVFVRSWVWISAGSWQFMHGFISHSLSRNTKYSWPPSVVYSKQHQASELTVSWKEVGRTAALAVTLQSLGNWNKYWFSCIPLREYWAIYYLQDMYHCFVSGVLTDSWAHTRNRHSFSL